MRRIALCLVLVLSILSSCTDAEEPAESTPSPQTTPRAGNHNVSCTELDQYVTRVRRGYVPVRSPDLALIPHEPNYIGEPESAVHTGPYDFLAEVPLVFYGPSVVEPLGRVDSLATVADVAPTIASAIGFDDFEVPDGRALTEVRSRQRPRVVLVVVWDGGGWNTLEEHPRAWQFLKRLEREGVSFSRATVGSTPTVTPPIHTTLGTGAFPRAHGIPHVKMTTANGSYIDPMEGNSPVNIRVPTLGDVYDRTRDNRPLVGVVATVNWHLGMIGKGALFPGGDRDVGGLFSSSGTAYGDPAIYEVPSQVDDSSGLDARTSELDGSDGESDGSWRTRPLDDLGTRYATPAYVRWFGSTLRRVIDAYPFGRDAVPDLLYTNFKSLDDAIHRWGIESREAREVLGATDAELKAVVRHLDRRVGRGRWMVVVTADHGTMPLAERSGGWAIRGADLRQDLNRAFDLADQPLFERVNSAGIYLNDAAARDARLDLRDVGRWLLDYTANDNLYEIDNVPDYYSEKSDVPLFDGVVAGRRVVARSCGGSSTGRKET